MGEFRGSPRHTWRERLTAPRWTRCDDDSAEARYRRIPWKAWTAPLRRPPCRIARQAAEIHAGLDDCLGNLIRPRRIIVACRLQGYSVPETATFTGWTRKKVEHLALRGMEGSAPLPGGQGAEAGARGARDMSEDRNDLDDILGAGGSGTGRGAIPGATPARNADRVLKAVLGELPASERSGPGRSCRRLRRVRRRLATGPRFLQGGGAPSGPAAGCSLALGRSCRGGADPRHRRAAGRAAVLPGTRRARAAQHPTRRDRGADLVGPRASRGRVRPDLVAGAGGNPLRRARPRYPTEQGCAVPGR